MASEKNILQEIKKGEIGYGILIENDGFVSLDLPDNKVLKESIEQSYRNNQELPNPFVVSAVFQKYGIQNANGRIYPESVLRREVEKYQTVINDRRGYGECYTSDAMCLTENGWKHINEVCVGEKVLSLNIETKELESKVVYNVIKKEYNGNLIHIKSDKIDELVTPEHKMLICDSQSNFSYVSAYDLMNGCFNEYIPKICNSMCYEKCEDIQNITFEKEYFNGEVYCIDVEDNHNWYVMCNGHSHWTGNCNHPETCTIDLDRIAMNIIELHWVNSTLVGKMEIPITEGFRKLGIVSCKADLIAQWLISGLKIGVSSRGVGTVSQQFGQTIVNDDYEITCWDVVSQPSTPGAYIDFELENLKPYMENKESDKQPLLKEDTFTKFEKWLIKD